MLKKCLMLVALVGALGSSVSEAAAQHMRPYEFDETQVALSVERFMGLDYTDMDGVDSDVKGRLFLNEDVSVPTNLARFGVDVFVERFSVGLAAGVTTEESGIIAPRVGYMLGITPTVGLWMRAGGFYAATPAAKYYGFTGEALLSWFPYAHLAVHFGPTVDVAFADKDNPDYTSVGIPEVGITAWF